MDDEPLDIPGKQIAIQMDDNDGYPFLCLEQLMERVRDEFGEEADPETVFFRHQLVPKPGEDHSTFLSDYYNYVIITCDKPE
jgi:hypothetical protein